MCCRNKDFEKASESVGKERLAASVRLAGMDSAVVCSTNFTVVKVDVVIFDVGENEEETSGVVLQYMENGVSRMEARKWRKAVSITCTPKYLQDSEMVSITHIKCRRFGEDLRALERRAR